MRRWPFHVLSALVVAGFSYMAYVAVWGHEDAARSTLAAMSVWQMFDSAHTWLKFARRK